MSRELPMANSMESEKRMNSLHGLAHQKLAFSVAAACPARVSVSSCSSSSSLAWHRRLAPCKAERPSAAAAVAAGSSDYNHHHHNHLVVRRRVRAQANDDYNAEAAPLVDNDHPAGTAAGAAPTSTTTAATTPQTQAQDAREESLVLLEWPAVSQRVARHAATARGRRVLLGDITDPTTTASATTTTTTASTNSSRGMMLPVPSDRAESERLLALTRDAYRLAFDLARPLPFAGVHDVAEDVRLAAKGMVLDGKKLLRIAETMGAARKIRRHIEAAADGGMDDDDDQHQEQTNLRQRRVRDAPPRPSPTQHPVPRSDHDEYGTTHSRLPEFRKLVAAFRTWPEVEAEIRGAIDDFGLVLDSCDSHLSGLRASIRDVTGTIRERLTNLMRIHGDAIQERVISTRYDRFVISVKTSQKAVFKGVVHDVSATGATAYVEPQAVRALNDKLRELVAREKARVIVVLRRLSEDVVAQTADDVDHFTAVLATIDAATARAYASRSLDGVDVVFDDTQPMNLRGVRHPLLSWKAMDEDEALPKNSSRSSELRADDSDERRKSTSATANTVEVGTAAPFRGPLAQWKKKVVPSDFVLNESVRCVCVTGPNTGGKTISLKTLGVAVLMAKAGLFIPAQLLPEQWRIEQLKRVSQVHVSTSSKGGRYPAVNKILSTNYTEDTSHVARMPYFDSVLADIGDDQSLVQSLSTFSGHIQRIKRILRSTTSKSLVLFDEIGSGTDPAEGAALGMALLKHLAGVDGPARARLTFATTHHGELKTLKYEGGMDASNSPFENASVEFDDEIMAPTFRLLWGIPGRSNALAIARRLGLHGGVIDSAEKLMTGGEADGKRVDLSKMVAELEREKRAAEDAKIEAEAAWTDLDRLRTELQSKMDAMRATEEDLRKQQQKALDDELRLAKKQIGDAIKEMQRSGGSMRSAGEASSRIEAIRASSGASSSREMVTPEGGSGGGGGQEVTLGMIRPGYQVVVPRLGSGSMEVAEVDASRKEVTVSSGAFRARVKVAEVSSVSRPRRSNGLGGHAAGSALARRQAASAASEGGRKRLAPRTSANTVDVRGERVEDAEAKVDLAISRAISSGKLWVIHGHGTGRLRTGLRTYLSQHSSVERFEYADQSDGGTGVTIAYLVS